VVPGGQYWAGAQEYDTPHPLQVPMPDVLKPADGT
jgi:hypothetical protein